MGFIKVFLIITSIIAISAIGIVVYDIVYNVKIKNNTLINEQKKDEVE